MVNASKELEEKLFKIYGRDYESKILAAEIRYDIDVFESKHIDLPVVSEPYSLEQVNYFLDSLDFSYNDGYGLQYLYGTVWFKDGTWLEREEYDGSEWWVYKKAPQIPNRLYEYYTQS
jgi:hypothetical protein